jgi:hypothetical protein
MCTNSYEPSVSAPNARMNHFRPIRIPGEDRIEDEHIEGVNQLRSGDLVRIDLKP